MLGSELSVLGFIPSFFKIIFKSYKQYLNLALVCRYLGWDVSQDMFYVKSVQNKDTALERQVRSVLVPSV